MTLANISLDTDTPQGTLMLLILLARLFNIMILLLLFTAVFHHIKKAKSSIYVKE